MAQRMSPRLASRCVGWNCLTAAQKFGIIFSSAVVACILMIAWMYYLGKAAESRRRRSSISLPGGGRAQRIAGLPDNTALGQLPIAQQIPGYPAQVIYQPVIYSLAPHQVPRAQPYALAGPYMHGAAPPVYPHPMPLTGHIQAPPPRASGALGGGASSPSSSSTSRLGSPSPLPSQKLTWQQRLSRSVRHMVTANDATGLSRNARPYSQEDIELGVRSRKNQGRGGTMDAHFERALKTNDVRHPSLDDDRQSTRSTAATVHSDDYDIVPPRQ